MRKLHITWLNISKIVTQLLHFPTLYSYTRKLDGCLGAAPVKIRRYCNIRYLRPSMNNNDLIDSQSKETFEICE